MIAAAVYVRKSHEQPGVADEAKSVARQIEHGTAFAESQGWTVDPAHVFIDDGISSALFGAGRPGLARLLNTLTPRPPFQILVMAEESRLGREAIETGWTLKQILDAGVRVFFYLERRERTLDSAMEKVMLSLTNFASEMEREKARQRTHDAMRRKARAGEVCGGTVFGYRNVEVRTAEGKRSHVERAIDPAQAAIVARIFADYAAGFGFGRIAKRLNAEGVPAPRARGWAPSAIREMLRRDLYRGRIVWNRTAKAVRGGVTRQRRRDERDWIHREAPELALVPLALAAAVDARLRVAATTFPRGPRGVLTGGAVQAPGYASPYLLTNFARCAVCTGPLGTITRTHGTGKARWPVRFYGCTTRDRRGPTICANATLLRREILDAAVLDAVRVSLDDDILRDVIAGAMARRQAQQGSAEARRPVVARELHAVEHRITRLVDAIASGGPVEELLERLRAERARKATLVEEQRRLEPSSRPATDLRSRVTAVVADLRRHLGIQVARTRQLLQIMLPGPIAMVPVVEDGRRGYRFTGRLRLNGLLLAGEGIETRQPVVAPTGFVAWWACTSASRCRVVPSGRSQPSWCRSRPGL